MTHRFVGVVHAKRGKKKKREGERQLKEVHMNHNNKGDHLIIAMSELSVEKT